MEARQRKTYLDALRIIACLFVLYNHTAGQTMRLTQGASGAVAVGMLYYSKPAVPIFLMVTGALLLGRVDSYTKILRRTLRMLAVLLLFSLVYYAVDCAVAQAPFDLLTFFDKTYHTNMTNSFWYLYAYLGVLIALPILQRISVGIGPRGYRYILFWVLLDAGVMPILVTIWPEFYYNPAFILPLFGGVIGSLFIGYHMDNNVKPSRAYTVIAIVAPIMIVALSAALTMKDAAMFGMFDNAFLFPALFGGMCLFYLIKLVFTKYVHSERICAWISALGKLTFCMYLVSDMFILRLRFIFDALTPYLHVNGAGIVYTLIIIAVSTLASAVLTRLPGLRKLL